MGQVAQRRPRRTAILDRFLHHAQIIQMTAAAIASMKPRPLPGKQTAPGQSNEPSAAGPRS